MKTRPSFECWQCERTFGQVVDLEGEPVLLLECPYWGCKPEPPKILSENRAA